jgi:hypothetical protein
VYGDQHRRDEVMSRSIDWAVVGDPFPNDDRLMIVPEAPKGHSSFQIPEPLSNRYHYSQPSLDT